MASSDESDEIVLRRSGGASASARNRASNSPHNLLDSRNANTSVRNLVAHAMLPKAEQSQAIRPKMERKEARPEDLEELRRLQAEVIAEAGKNKFNRADLLTSNPEALTNIARRGPGADPASEISKLIAERLIVSNSGNKQNESQSPQVMTNEERYQAQWTLYKQDTRVYPKIENGQLVLQDDPTPGHVYMPPAVAPDGSLLIGLPQPPQAPEGIDPQIWEEPLPVNWDFSPRGCADPEVYSDWFCDWLDSTMAICYFVDIYHKTFFDGTAHTDGELSLFIPDLDSGGTHLDTTDEETRLHHHETADGYRYNFLRHNDKDGISRAHYENTDRSAYLETGQGRPEPNPNVPKANIYLRPAEYTDISELVSLCNWHVANSTQCTNVEEFSHMDIRQRIDDCKRRRFPFIVAVERRHFFQTTMPRDQSEKILGYATASDFMGSSTVGRYIAGLEVFVHPTKMGKRVGHCLMDKLLEICDPTYIPKQGYFFDCSPDDRYLYSRGGSRKLTRVIFTFVFSEDEPDDYNRVKEWLERCHFEEQGILKGAAVKFNK
jgi:L-amino acid N-acyltransferase YncA